MQKDVLLEIVKQNQYTSSFSFDRITEQNSSLRLNDRTASVGFIYRHIGETINLFSQFLGVPTDVINTTMGEFGTGQHFDIGYSRELIERGYKVLEELVETARTRTCWSQLTLLFGTVSKVRLFAHGPFSHLKSCRTDSSDVSERKKAIRG
jgi:hypothetical protein